jgi:hypothetical protein
MTILKLTEETKKYFISSNLLHDDGIECPDIWIADICALVDNLQSFHIKLYKLNITELVKLYEFFDEYCISKGIIKIIEARIYNYDKDMIQDKNYICHPDVGDEIICKETGEKNGLRVYGYTHPLFFAKTFKIQYNSRIYNCVNIRTIHSNIIYKVVEDNGDQVDYENYCLIFDILDNKIVRIYDSCWGEFTVDQS